MSTFDKDFADRLKVGNGWLDGNSDNSMGDNPRCIRIVEYTNAWGKKAYGATFAGEDHTKYLRPSEFVINPAIYWEAPK